MIIEREFRECAKIKTKVRWSIDASVAKAKTKTLRTMNVNEVLAISRSRLLIDDLFISSHKTLRIMNVNEVLAISHSRLLIDDLFISSYKTLSMMRSSLDTYDYLKQNAQTSLLLTFNSFLSLSSSLISRRCFRLIYFSSNSNFSLLFSFKKDFELLV